jgi:hypothetical protein
MKKLSILVLLFVYAFTACDKKEDLYQVLPIDQVKAPVLKVHEAMLVTADNCNTTTLFAWSAADFGVPTATQYSLYATFGEKEPALIAATFGDSLHVSLLTIAKALYRSGMVLGTPTDVRFHLTASIVATYGSVHSAPITVSVDVNADVPLYPDAVYLIGKEFGDWNWSSNAVVEMTPVNGHAGKFWAVRHFADPEAGFKWCNVKDWKDDFFSLGTDVGFAVRDKNAFVPAAGFYTIVVDYTTNTITLEPAQVYGIGDCFGSWDTGQYPFVADGAVMKQTTSAAGDLRIYARTPAAGTGNDWWRTEFVLLNGRIAYRGNGGDQDRMPVAAGKVIRLDFNQGTGSIQ